MASAGGITYARAVSMRNKVVGALVISGSMALLASACGEQRKFDSPNAGGAAGSGVSGGGAQTEGGAQAGGGTQAGGDAQAGGGAQASGGTEAVAGADNEAGGSGGDTGVCEGSECPVCPGATPEPGTACGDCGKYVCNPDGITTSCLDPKFNACGGCAELDAEPGQDCGDCGTYQCSADKQSVACEDPGKNGCGGCGVLANAPNSSCDTCGDWECSADKTAVNCSGANANACGGCGTLANQPGGDCGQCGKYECSVDKTSTTCKDPGENACGGCSVLTGTLGAACGNGGCGKLACSTDKNSLVCQGDVPNACGGCATLTPSSATKGGSCGVCSQKWACNADKNSLSCSGAGANVCGGCTAISGTLGASCGACSVTACASDKNSLVCNSQCTTGQVCVSGLNQCKTPDCSAANSCGQTDGAGGLCTNAKGKCPAKPNSTGACAGSSCAYTCSNKALSCSTAAEPKCGSWNFDSKTVEGWRVQSAANSAADGGLFLATPPGTGAGTWSLALKVNGTAGKTCVAIETTFCDGAPATGIYGKFHAFVWYKPEDANGGLSGPGFTYFAPEGGGTDYNTPPNVWFDLPTFDVAGANVTGVAVNVCGIEGHKGTLYFDNFYFE